MSHAHEIVEGLVKEGALSPEAAERARTSAADLVKEAGLTHVRVPTNQMIPQHVLQKLRQPKGLLQRLVDDPRGTAPALAAGGAAVTAGGLGAGYVGHHAMSGADALVQALMKGHRFDKMLEVHPELEGYGEESLQLAFNTLHRFNPEMAADPLVAGTFVRRVMDAQGIDTKTVGEISRARQPIPGMVAAQKAGDTFTKSLGAL